MTTTDTSPAAQIIARAQVAKELAEKATPGPWEVEKGSDLEGTPFCHIEGWTTLDHTDWLCLDPDDARFIAASRTLVPQMAAAVMTLVEARDEMYRQNNLISALIIFDDALTTAAAAMGDGDE